MVAAETKESEISSSKGLNAAVDAEEVVATGDVWTLSAAAKKKSSAQIIIIIS